MNLWIKFHFCTEPVCKPNGDAVSTKYWFDSGAEGRFLAKVRRVLLLLTDKRRMKSDELRYVHG